MPYGIARRIVLAMRPGDVVIVRPDYVIGLRKAARQEGRRVITNTFWTARGERRIRMEAVLQRDWRTGHIFQRMPVRKADDGRFVRDGARIDAEGSAP